MRFVYAFLYSRMHSIKTTLQRAVAGRRDTSLTFGGAYVEVLSCHCTPDVLHYLYEIIHGHYPVDAKLDRELKRLSRSLKQSKSDIARDALKRQVALLRFRKTRQAILSEIEA
jgi:hypothetical protein